ncbi:CD1107 family mobile element protein [Butyrivibrio sp. FC2001]|uniref:CD1107 family mobile element protein n=1 Tax=Butyrivibrio sp. FC2001 TaxID=1280671 RepID=UPI0004209B71|nr:DUF4366 domain-containing protein [Butyrivibrio sp. FC2001]
MKRKIITVLGTCMLSLLLMGVPVYAQGDGGTTDAATADGVLPENPGEEQQPEEPEEPQEPQPLSFDGTGTVVDNIKAGSKQFYTISTDAGNVFYLIIDFDKDNNNVYFLDTTKERDLLALAEAAEGAEVQEIAEEEPPKAVEPVEEEPIEEPAPEPEEHGNSTLPIITLLIILIGGGGVMFYYFIYKPKKDADEAEEFEETFQFEDEDSVDRSFDEAGTFDREEETT